MIEIPKPGFGKLRIFKKTQNNIDVRDTPAAQNTWNQLSIDSAVFKITVNAGFPANSVCRGSTLIDLNGKRFPEKFRN